MIRIMLVQPERLVRMALAAMLDVEPDLEVVADVQRGSEANDASAQCTPDIAVIDADLGDTDAVGLAEELHTTFPAVRTVVITSGQRAGTVRRAFDAQVGGLVHKDASCHDLVQTIRSVHRGMRVFGAELTSSSCLGARCPLTPRELEILKLASSGAETTEIAEQLFLATGTVRNHLAAVTTKLNARNRMDAIRMIREAGWI